MNVAGSSGAGAALRSNAGHAVSRAAARPALDTSSSYRRGLATSAPASVQNQRDRRQHDKKLRLAIDLYHTSDKFFATRPTLAKQEMLGMERVLGDPNSNDGRAAASRPDSSMSSKLGDDDVRKNDFAVGDVDGERGTTAKAAEADDPPLRTLDEQLDFHILAALQLLPLEGESNEQYRIRTARGKNPLHLRNSYMLQDVIDARRSGQDAMLDDVAINDLRRIHERPGSSSSSSMYASTSSLTPINDSRQELPDPADVGAVRSLIAETARKAAQRKRESDLNTRDTHSMLDNRSARVRDALFGTVAGRLPGLEVVRDRVKDPKVQEEIKRLIEDSSSVTER